MGFLNRLDEALLEFGFQLFGEWFPIMKDRSVIIRKALFQGKICLITYEKVEHGLALFELNEDYPFMVIRDDKKIVKILNKYEQN